MKSISSVGVFLLSVSSCLGFYNAHAGTKAKRDVARAESGYEFPETTKRYICSLERAMRTHTQVPPIDEEILEYDRSFEASGADLKVVKDSLIAQHNANRPTNLRGQKPFRIYCAELNLKPID